MITRAVTFPDDSEIDKPYRSRRFTVNYESKIGHDGISFGVYVDGKEVEGYTAIWVIDHATQDRPLEFVENRTPVRSQGSQWPAEDWF